MLADTLLFYENVRTGDDATCLKSNHGQPEVHKRNKERGKNPRVLDNEVKDCGETVEGRLDGVEYIVDGVVDVVVAVCRGLEGDLVDVGANGLVFYHSWVGIDIGGGGVVDFNGGSSELLGLNDEIGDAGFEGNRRGCSSGGLIVGGRECIDWHDCHDRGEDEAEGWSHGSGDVVVMWW